MTTVELRTLTELYIDQARFNVRTSFRILRV